MLPYPHPPVLTSTGPVGLADLWVLLFSPLFSFLKKKKNAWKVKVYWGQEVQ